MLCKTYGMWVSCKEIRSNLYAAEHATHIHTLGTFKSEIPSISRSLMVDVGGGSDTVSLQFGMDKGFEFE